MPPHPAQSSLLQEEEHKISPMPNSTFCDLEGVTELVDQRDANEAAIRHGIFNLISTIVGGGLLSLPYAFAQCGVALGCVLLAGTAMLSGYTVQLLIRSSILTGQHSFQGIAQATFGVRGSLMTTLLLVMLTWLCAVAYVILFGDIAMPVIQSIAGISDDQRDSHSVISIRTALQLGAVLLSSPLCVAENLDALKFTSLTSVLSILLLVVAIVVNSSQDGFGHTTSFAAPGSESRDHNILWVGGLKSFTAFSIISVSFLCHFNVLSVADSVSVVTRPRMHRLVCSTMGTCCFLYMIAAVFGYLNFRDIVCGNILLNYDSNSSKLHLVTFGRIGLFFTLWCSFPLLVHPCRENAEKLMTLLRGEQTQPEAVEEDLLEEKEPVAPVQQQHSNGPRVLHTILITMSASISAVFIPGVQVVWTFMGSTVSVLISYILPTAFYLRIKHARCKAHPELYATEWKSWQTTKAWVVLFVGVGLLVLCTTMSIVEQIRGDDSHCPHK